LTDQPTQTGQTPKSPDSGNGLCSRSFIGLLITQFLGAINDNMFRWLVVPIGKSIIEQKYGSESFDVALPAGLACFVLPYVLLIAYAGYLADRFSKRTVIVGCKIAEVLIMILGVIAIVVGDIGLMFGVIALMGAQSALFAPSKLGSIPEIVGDGRVSAANGLVGMTTVFAIVIGSVAGGVLYTLTTPVAAAGQAAVLPGRHMWWISAVSLIGVAVAGLAASLLISPLKSANPTRPFPWNAPRQTLRDLALLMSMRPLLRAALGCTAFMCLGALAQMTVDPFVITELEAGQAHVGVLLAVLVVGVGAGSVLAGIWSGGRIELGLVPLGAGTIALGAILLSAVPPPGEQVFSPAYFWSCTWLFTLGIGAGLYNIPIMAFLQRHSPKKSRGSILAASNFLTFMGMLLAAGLFWLWRSVFDLSARNIFLILGVATVPVLIYVLWLLPGATARFIVWLLSHTVYRVGVKGRENLPKDGGALVVANHVSYIDGILLLLYFPRRVRIVVRVDASHRWFFRWLAKDLGAIFIEPGKRSLVESIRTARQALTDGEMVCIFPEGKITRTGEIGEFHRGFLAIIKNTDTPVVPIFLAGLWGSIFSYEGGRVLRKWPRRWPYPVSIRIGPTIAKPSDAEEVRHVIVGMEESWRKS
jgi:acyl-[acyl-carrier-protein]-phospholipid O-acyltransferase/long-chain-fatty-acid--[acyl-carrier-protein] ligase